MLIAVLQVVLTSLVTYYFVTKEYRDLSSESLITLEKFLIDQKKQELKNYTALAKSSVNHLYSQSIPDNTAIKSVVAQIFDGLLYNGDDGYFFVYDGNGTNISHPKEPFRIGKNYWELEDESGEKIIQILLNNAKNGGGFYRYPWLKPSLKASSDKLGYSIYLEKWDWMIGTGVYLDDVYAQLSQLQNEMDRHTSKTKQIILIVAISSIFMIFLFGLIVNLNQKKKTDLKINQLGQRIITLQENERRHFSRELHDGIVQILISIKYSLEATGRYIGTANIQKPEQLNKAQSNLNTAIQEIRRISHHLHPRILDELGLTAALEALASEFTERTAVNIHIVKPAARKLLPDNINTTLYRVVQEALTNIEKHAKATEVAITFEFQNNWLTLNISDNGCGFNQELKYEQPPQGIGLRNLAERVEYHSGRFTVTSDTGGTNIQVMIPKSSFANHFNKTSFEAQK
ncbi:cache domain-containing protein [Glaciecola sp. 33A]|jgi:two-component system NarL family sensor kinase|uniref:cache domain-containing protein n=1 Tax=Glaciecola sp. 33A TaxID=2057807 RepID=UPI001E57588D|nr:cache domain-containing protein [Glaciecola sp. 33A]